MMAIILANMKICVIYHNRGTANIIMSILAELCINLWPSGIIQHSNMQPPTTQLCVQYVALYNRTCSPPYQGTLFFLSMSHKICTCFGCALFYWGYIVRLNIHWYYNKTRCKPCAEFLWCTTNYWYVASCSAPDCHLSCKRYQLIIRLRKILLLYCLLHSL